MNSMTIQVYIDTLAERFAAADLFYGHGTDNPMDESVYLVFCILDLPFDTELDLSAQLLTEDQYQRLEEVARRRVDERIPTAYLVGSAWFAGHRFIVDENVLIPRSPIAELINNGFAGLLHREPKHILDMCTGSGCIGIAAALAFPDAAVVLADVSTRCLDIASQNIRLHQLESRVASVLSDGFTEIEGKFDLILSNPPYVSDSEYENLPLEYLREPALGLISPNDGLELPITLMKAAASYLTDDGLFVMEVGYSAEALVEALPQVPFLWLEFAHGGEGVFCLTKAQLQTFSDSTV